MSAREVAYYRVALPRLRSFADGEVIPDIAYTHPAIFMVEYSLTQLLLEMGLRPAAVLGSSLGGVCRFDRGRLQFA